MEKTKDIHLKGSKLRLRQDRQKLLLCILPLIKIFLFSYVPMFGLVIAFQNFKPRTLFRSEFVGFKNFEVIFSNPDLLKLLTNATILNFLYTLCGIVASVIFSLLLFEITNKAVIKIFQSTTLMPMFVSWPLIGLFVTALLGTNGALTGFLYSLTGEKIGFYSQPQYWRTIMAIIHIWRTAGISMIGYYAILLNTDKSIYEAADIDGAGRLQKMVFISFSNFTNMITLSAIMMLGNIIKSDFSMNFFIIGGNTMLYDKVDVLESYMYRALMNASNYSNIIAMDLVQGSIGFVLALSSNLIIKRFAPESSIF